MMLQENSPSIAFWKDIPFPLELKAFLWNVSNPEEVKNGLEAPKLTEIGPFVFREYRNKSGIHWNHLNGTVSYRQTRHWVFDASSSLPLDTLVTILNVPAAAVSKNFFHMNPILRPAASLFLLAIKEKLFVTQEAGDIIFNGYKDPLLTEASKFHPIPGVQDKFAIFYKRNNSADFDGVFNIYTGELGLDKFGTVAKWNYKNSTGLFPSPCGDLRGGVDYLPPFEDNKEELEIYSTDLCRPLRVELKNRASKTDSHVSVHEYHLNSTIFYGNSSLNPSNKCYEGGNSLPSGVFNASSCHFGAPIFISNPHFFEADPFYSSQFKDGSMQPNVSKHESYLKIEPITGLLMEVHIKSQFNVYLRHVPMIEMFSNINNTYFPIAWFDYSMKVGPEMSLKIWILSNLPFIFIVAGLSILSLGLGNIILGAIFLRAAIVAEKKGNENNRLIIDDAITQESVEDDQVSDHLVDRSQS
ncbi:protein peste [Lepeophtheirus salmonis]|uniref:protein peste n=1 Tax=Lepeophtheirus salmonis TaxID=72036 RepID=UPI001AE54AB5|nr:protein peste-like [Lepeophtheirus salmonis]